MKTLTLTEGAIKVLQNGFKNMYLDIEGDLKSLTQKSNNWGSEDRENENQDAFMCAHDEVVLAAAQLKTAVEMLIPDEAYEGVNNTMKKVRDKADEFEETLRLLADLTKMQVGYRKSRAVSARKKATLFLGMCERFVDIF